MKMHVCITIDTEFTIGGAFSNACRQPVSEQAVWCNVDGESQGLGFLLSRFRKHGIQATFFVETLHRHYFGNDPMRPIAGRIAEEGHEVQLHQHPCWSIFRHSDWRERARHAPPSDAFHGRDVQESLALIQEGLRAFEDWRLPAPQVFRAGNLHHDDALYTALSKAGIRYSSNIGCAIFDSGDARYRLYSGAHRRHGVLEMPVLTFADWSVMGRKHLKSLTISGSSFAETRTLLERAHGEGVPLVVILTHPFEFIQSKDAAFQQARRHGVNQRRLEALCEFLHRNSDRFVASGMACAATSIEEQASRNVLLESASWQSLARAATQVCYDRYGALALAVGRAR